MDESTSLVVLRSATEQSVVVTSAFSAMDSSDIGTGDDAVGIGVLDETALLDSCAIELPLLSNDASMERVDSVTKVEVVNDGVGALLCRAATNGTCPCDMSDIWPDTADDTRSS